MRKRYGALVSVLLLLLCLAGCSMPFSKKETGEQSYLQYYINSEETQLIEYDFETEESTTDGLIDAVADNLRQQKTGSDRSGLLTDAVSITDYRLEDKTLILNMSFEYTQLSKTREILIRAGLVKSFTQIDGVDSLIIQVGGENITNEDGSPVGAMKASDFVEAEGKEIDDYQKGTFKLYYANAAGDRLVCVEKEKYYLSSIPIERQLVDFLMESPEDDALQKTLPDNLEIINVTLSDGIVYVNLDASFLSGRPPLSDEIVVYSLVNTLLELEGATKVQIAIEGETNPAIMGEDINLNEFLTKNKAIMEE